MISGKGAAKPKPGLSAADQKLIEEIREARRAPTRGRKKSQPQPIAGFAISPELLYPVETLAAGFCVNAATARRWMAEGLVSRKRGKQVWVLGRDFIEWTEQFLREPQAAAKESSEQQV